MEEALQEVKCYANLNRVNRNENVSFSSQPFLLEFAERLDAR